MGKRVRMFSAVMLLVVLAAISGCGRKGEGAASPQVSVERSGEGGQGGAVKLHDEIGESQVEVWEFDPREESLDVPLYPSAELVPGSALVSRTARGDKVLLGHQAEYLTPDDFRAVTRWYREKMGSPMESVERETTWVATEEGVIRSVIVEEVEGGTRIRIMELRGDLDLRNEG